MLQVLSCRIVFSQKTQIHFGALGSKSFGTAFPAVAGYEAIARICKGQAASAPANDIRVESYFIVILFNTAV
jgi:hypothetical protein